MTLNDLAIAIVCAEPDDQEELQQIHTKLLAFHDSMTGDLQTLASEAIQIIETLLSSGCGDKTDLIEHLGAKITQIQQAAAEKEEADMEAKEQQGESQAPLENRPEETTEMLPESIEINAELLSEFITECLEHIENSESSLLDLEYKPDDDEAINSIFRAFHTIKGTSGFLGLQEMQKLAHRAENLMDRGRNKEIQITGSYADLALESIDMLKEMVDSFQANEDGTALCDGQRKPYRR